MKYSLIIIGMICFMSRVSHGQDTKDLFFEEFYLSANRTIVNNLNTDDRFGFGLGAYHSFREDKKLDLIFGLEYNRTSQYKKSIYEGHFANSTDLTYNINCFSIPFGLRLNTGSRNLFYIETGGFADFVRSSNRTGTMHEYYPDENNQIIYTETEIDENVRLSDCVGFYMGIGVRIPISKFELIVKPDYKFGINELYSYQDDIFNRYFRINIFVGIKTR